jgi:hypothetical protein
MAGLVRITIVLLRARIIISCALRAIAMRMRGFYIVAAVLWRLIGAKMLCGNKTRQ